ncbi:MAG: hypothetical protein QJT81_02635 [Candidatus Thiothrix putei]|uniref:Uncharacterized protein n=1 Tax=Candidatus Thiothrix putei TaxID=3080811 RepID=A0AA95HCH6_9GAMM|nr:MAG: hypothetical protein QJT81_02635 [Candidatus Thiothrix putei]
MLIGITRGYLPPFAVSRKEGSYFGTVPKLNLNGHELELIKELAQYAGQIVKSEDLKVMVYSPNNINYSLPTTRSSLLYPYLFDECLREIDSSVPNGTEAWQKESLVKAQVQAAQADKYEVQMIEAPAKIPDREFDFSKLDDVETFYTLLNDPLLGPPTGNFIVLAITVLSMGNSTAARMFWQQMLTTPKVKVVSIEGKKFMYFHGGQNFQTLMTATTEKALAIAREELIRILTKTDPDLWNLGLDRIEAKVDERLARANATYIEAGKGYRVGIASSKVAKVEQFFAPTVDNLAKGNVLGVWIVVGIESFKYAATPEADRYLSDFIISLGTSLTKFAIATAGGILLAGAFLSGGWVIVAGLGLGFVLGWILDVVDNELGVTNAMKEAFKNVLPQDPDSIYTGAMIAP